MNQALYCLLLLLAFVSPAIPAEPPALREACLATMMDLTGALRSLQVREAGHPDFGAIRCPSCGILHTRGAEAVYPFAVAFSHTGDTAYASAAIDVAEWLFRWQKAGGEWDETPWTWTGTTADQLLMLGQAYPILKPRLSAVQQARWESVMRRAADFLVRTMDPAFASINYCPTSAAALMVINGLMPDAAYVRKAYRLAHQVLAKMDDDGFIQGEAARAHGVKYGVDLGYEMDMSLWGLGLYAGLNNDVVVDQAVARSLAKNLQFIYPNGAIDGSWGARCYKWTTYGSKTADGVQVLLSMYAGRDPRYLTAAMRNLTYLRTMIKDGMVGNGPHFWKYFRSQVCIYPTFARAKALAMAAMLTRHERALLPPLPSDRGNWLRVYPTVDVALARSRHFMMTVSAYGYRDPSRTNDGQYNQHPTGGSVCNLWAEGAGFLTTSSQTRYVRGESIHMPVAKDTAICLTPRIEYRDSLGYFTNLYEFEGRQTTRSTRETTAVVTTTGELKDEDWTPGGVSYSLTNALYDNGIVKTIRLTFHDRTPTVRIVEPIVTDDATRVTFEGPRRVLVHSSSRTFAIDLLDGATALRADPANPFSLFPFPAMRATPVVMLVNPPDNGSVAVVRYRIALATPAAREGQ
jgi:hypothetical protein